MEGEWRSHRPVLRQPIGRTTAIHKTSHKEREGSKASYSCSHLGCTGPSQCRRDCCRVRRFLRSLMTSTSTVLYTGCSRSTEFWRNCRTMQRSLCIMGRLKCGTELEFHFGGLTSSPGRVKLEDMVWRGDASLPRCQQGVKILGVPVGQPEFVHSFLERKIGGGCC